MADNPLRFLSNGSLTDSEIHTANSLTSQFLNGETAIPTPLAKYCLPFFRVQSSNLLSQRIMVLLFAVSIVFTLARLCLLYPIILCVANDLMLAIPLILTIMVLDYLDVDTEMFQAFLDQANRQIKPERKRNILILDNASWHRRASINWGSFEPFFLPPYSPDLNPIERIWLTLEDRWFNNHISKNRDALIKRLDKAILDVIDNPDQTKKTAAIGQHF